MTQLTTLRQIKLASDLPFQLPEIEDISDKLPKNPKGSWLTMPLRRKDGSVRSGPRDFFDIRRISVHHTGVEGGTPAGHANYHINKKTPTTPDGYGGIAYHIYVNRNHIYQVNDLLALTWHTGSNNYDTIGIAIEGDFTKRNLTNEERQALYGAIITVMEIFNIPVENVRGHREMTNDTSCPGFNMNQVRDDLKNTILEMDYRRSAEYRAIKIQELYSRVNHLYAIYYNQEQYAADAERKLYTLYQLAEQYELMLPTQKGKTIA